MTLAHKSILLAMTALATTIAVMASSAHSTDAAKAYNRPSAISPPGDFTRGKKLAETCLACHGENAPMMGEPAVHQPKLRNQHPSSIFYALQNYKNGKRKNDFMTPMAAELSEQDMRDLSVYLSGPSEKRRPPPSDRQPATTDDPGRNKVVEHCGFCHGLTGQGVMDGVPALGGQHQDYLKHALAAYGSGARSNATMQAAVKKLTPQEIENITSYLSAQHSLKDAK